MPRELTSEDVAELLEASDRQIRDEETTFHRYLPLCDYAIILRVMTMRNMKGEYRDVVKKVLSVAYAVLPTIHNEKKGWGWWALDWIRGKSGFKRLIANEDYEHATVKLFRSLGYLPDNMLNDVVVWNDVIQNGDIAIVKRT